MKQSYIRHPDTASIDAEISALTASIARCVRQTRQSVGLSRREVSERSGVSQRYLAQIEAGEGNVSIALLVKLSHALNLPVSAFLADGAVIPPKPVDLKAGRIALIGLRGAGKSTLGRGIGEMLDLPFIELNQIIERESGLATAEVIAMYGPEGYRAFEHRALAQVIAAHQRVVLAVAGGIVGSDGTFEMLLDNFTTIWLRASPDEHMARVRSQGDERPMAGNPKALEELKAILTSRVPQYARADAALDTSGSTVAQSMRELEALLRSLHIQTQGR